MNASLYVYVIQFVKEVNLISNKFIYEFTNSTEQTDTQRNRKSSITNFIYSRLQYLGTTYLH
jgi:hypothetical protein